MVNSETCPTALRAWDSFQSRHVVDWIVRPANFSALPLLKLGTHYG